MGDGCGGPREARRQRRVPPWHTHGAVGPPRPGLCLPCRRRWSVLCPPAGPRARTHGHQGRPLCTCGVQPGARLRPRGQGNRPLADGAPSPALLRAAAGGSCLPIRPWKWGDLRAGDRDGIGASQQQLPLATPRLSGTCQPGCAPFLSPQAGPDDALQPAPLRVCTAVPTGCGAGPLPWPGHSQPAPLPETPSRSEPQQPPAASVASAPRFWGRSQLRGAGPWDAGLGHSPRAHVPHEPRRPGAPTS